MISDTDQGTQGVSQRFRAFGFDHPSAGARPSAGGPDGGPPTLGCNRHEGVSEPPGVRRLRFVLIDIASTASEREQLWRAHAGELIRYATLLVGPDDAADVVAAAFLQTATIGVSAPLGTEG
jgi:hypothetical protein